MFIFGGLTGDQMRPIKPPIELRKPLESVSLQTHQNPSGGTQALKIRGVNITSCPNSILWARVLLMEAHRWLATGFVVLVLVSFPFLLLALGLGWVHRWMEASLRKLTFNLRGAHIPR